MSEQRAGVETNTCSSSAVACSSFAVYSVGATVVVARPRVAFDTICHFRLVAVCAQPTTCAITLRARCTLSL